MATCLKKYRDGETNWTHLWLPDDYRADFAEICGEKIERNRYVIKAILFKNGVQKNQHGGFFEHSVCAVF